MRPTARRRRTRASNQSNSIVYGEPARGAVYSCRSRSTRSSYVTGPSTLSRCSRTSSCISRISTASSVPLLVQHSTRLIHALLGIVPRRLARRDGSRAGRRGVRRGHGRSERGRYSLDGELVVVVVEALARRRRDRTDGHERVGLADRRPTPRLPHVVVRVVARRPAVRDLRPVLVRTVNRTVTLFHVYVVGIF